MKSFIQKLFKLLIYWQPVLSRWTTYALLAYITTFLDKTDKLLDFSDFNLWMWLRTHLFCFAAVLVVTRSFMDNTITNHKIEKVKSGDTEHLSKSDIESIKKNLNLG